jgi:hypothetical protein
MTAKKVLRRIHMLGTIWFMVCVGYMLHLALQRYGFHGFWGRCSLVFYLLFSLYLFAFVRGVSSTQRIQLEHPLTSTDYYMGFYASAPLLGGLAGILGMAGVGDIRHFLLGLAWGTLGTTLSVWIVIDPLAGVIEMLLPPSRRHRSERLARTETERRIRQERRNRVLEEAFTREEHERRQWQEHLRPHAERLAILSTTRAMPCEQAQKEALDIGAAAWKLGGLTCMRQLHNMTLDLVEQRQGRAETVDYVSHWWDGIGGWRRPSLG